MAPNIRPEMFYHPVVGASIAPASLGLLRFSDPSNLPKSKKTGSKSSHHNSDDPKNSGSSKNESLMTCIVTGQDYPKSQMIRFVLDPENMVVPDIDEKLPGQSFWIKAEREILKKAVWRNSFTSHARQTVSVPKDLIELTLQAIERKCAETLRLAKKSGHLRHGFVKVEEAFKENQVGLYIVARDAHDNGRQKIEKLITTQNLIDLWTRVQLSAALGDENIVHISINNGNFCEQILTLAKKLKDLQ